MEDYKKLCDAAPYAKHLNMKIVEVSEGYAKISMPVTENTRNFFGTVHGGAIFSLADQAFAACGNSLGNLAVLAQANMNFISTPEIGTEIFAEARIAHRGRKIYILEVSVQGSDGKLIAKGQSTLFVIKEGLERNVAK